MPDDDSDSEWGFQQELEARRFDEDPAQLDWVYELLRNHEPEMIDGDYSF